MKRNRKIRGGYLRFSHRIVWNLISFLSLLFTRLFLGFRCRDRYRIKKGESVIVLSNHQTDYDPFCIFPCFSKPLYAVATDSIFTGVKGKLLSYLGFIPKKKGASDVRAVMQISHDLAGGASVLLFPEGNRYYAEFQYDISSKLASFIKKTGATLLLFNIHGGSGVSPRFGAGRRHGRFYGEIKKILPHDACAAMSDDDLFCLIRDELRVYDSDSGERYKSGRRAEYLEKMLFVCPRCGGMQTLFSNRTHIVCRRCGLTAEYGEDLRLTCADDGFHLTRLIDWWDLQKKAVRDMKIIPGQPIFRDDGVRLFGTDRSRKKKRLAAGEMTVTDRQLTVGGFAVDLSAVDTATVVSGDKLVFSAGDDNYTVTGSKRFNPLKYVFLLHRLDTPLGKKPDPIYDALEESHVGMEI